MKKINIKVSTLFLLALLSSCSVVNQSPTSNEHTSIQNKNINKIIKGKAEFPDLSVKASNTMSTKATIDQIKVSSTVALIYPSNHPTNPNVTIATGLSDASGVFAINTDGSFNPSINDIFVLEATKRIGTSGNDIMNVRTYLKWTGSIWESITAGGILINKNTTAVAIIDNFDNSISPADTINKINNGVVSQIGSVTVDTINNVAGLVEYLLTSDGDPVRFINFQNNEYFINREVSLNKNYLISDKSCPNCDLTNESLNAQNLTGADLSNANLTNANLTTANLTNVNLTGANLTNANLTGATWINGNTTCLTGSIGKCLFPDTKVNTFTTGFQENARIAMNSSGNYVVTWQSINQDGNGYGVYAQRYNNAGVAQGSEFRVNTYTTGDQTSPSVAIDNTGNFVITWQSKNQDGGSYGVYAQRYSSNSTLTPVGTEFLVNTYTTGSQQTPSVASDPNGNFIITWASNEEDASGFSVYAQRFSSDITLTPIGTEFRVNTYTTDSQISPNAAIDGAGNFIVSWHSYGQDGGAYGIYAQRYSSNSTLTPIGTEFRVNTYTTGTQVYSSVAMDNAGNFIITWISDGQDGSNHGVYAQRYSSNPTLTPIGTEFRVNTFTTYPQNYSNVAMDNAGNFIITWQSYGQDGIGYGIYGQRYSSNSTLTPLGAEFKVNSNVIDNQIFTSVAMDNMGNFVVTWQSYGQDGSKNDIYKQRFDSLGTAR